MKLTKDLFVNNKQMEAGGRITLSTDKNAAAISRQIHALKPGQTLQGEVIARNGSEIQLQLAEDFILKARVEQGMKLDFGKTMIFEVKNNAKALTLLPLYTNTATDANVLKALDMAALPINEESILMTQQMMKAGLSIDRNSLQQMFRECNLFSQYSLSDMIDLHKLSLPVTEGNLEQLASYKNMSYQLEDGLSEVADSLQGCIGELLQKGDEAGAAGLLKDITKLLMENGTDELPAQAMEVESEGLPLEASENETVKLPAQSTEGRYPELLSKPLGNGMETGKIPMENVSVFPSEETVSTEEKVQQLFELLAEDGTKKETEPSVLHGKDGQKAPAALALLERLLQQGIRQKDKSLLRDLVGNKKIMDWVKAGLQKMWSISPEEVADKGEVTRLYQRLGKQLKEVTQALQNAGQTGTEAYRAGNNLTHNLDFLQQLNQTYAYLQLPLRMQQGRNAHGDLYVYTNKKHLASREGKISALLHLDMEHLGAVDVYVAMQQERVSTKFYVRDEDMLEFLEAHMDSLTARLQKRGYSCSVELQTRDNADDKVGQNVVERLLEKESQLPLVQYAFDVRT